MLVAGIAAGSVAAGGTAQAAVRAPSACPITANAATALFANGQPVGGTQLRASAGCANLAITAVDTTAVYRGWLRAAGGGRWTPCLGSFLLRKGPVRPPATLCRGALPGTLLKVVGPPSTHLRYNAVQAGFRGSFACHVTDDAATALLDPLGQPAGGTEFRESVGCSTLTVIYVAENASYRGYAHVGTHWVPCGIWYHLTAGTGRRVLCAGIGAGAVLKVLGTSPHHIRYNAEH